MTENRTEWVWRPGFGWVERPIEMPVVEVEDEQVQRESAAA